MLLVRLHAVEGIRWRDLIVLQRQLSGHRSRIADPTPLRQLLTPGENLDHLELVVIIARILVMPGSAIAAVVLRRAAFPYAEQGQVQVATGLRCGTYQKPGDGGVGAFQIAEGQFGWRVGVLQRPNEFFRTLVVAYRLGVCVFRPDFSIETFGRPGAEQRRDLSRLSFVLWRLGRGARALA